ncbi:Lactose permease [Fulvia fulva]|nr:Lactose permease [Fulvia fulva]
MTMGATKPRSKAIGDELQAVLPNDGRPWYTKAHLIKLNWVILSLMLFSSANGYDGSLMNGLQALDRWNDFMDTPTGAWLGFMGAIYWVGNGICYAMSAWVANKYGRKPGIYLGYIFLVLGVAITAGDRDYYFVLMRFFVGCASAWFSGPVIALINEIAYPPHRGVSNALYNCGWYVGGTIGAFVTFGTRNYESDWSWRIPTYLQILLQIVALPGLIFAPESPRWLVSKDRNEEARRMLEIAHDGVNNPALINYEMIEITATLQAERQAATSASYAEMITTKGNRHRLFISITIGLFSQWVGQGVISYYLPLVLNTVGVTSTRDQTLISACLQVWNLIWSVAAAVLVDVLGRRFLFLSSAAIMLLGYVITTALSGSFEERGNSGTGLAVIPFLFIFFAGYDISLTPLVTAYPCEIWPYRLRSRGLTVMGISVVVGIVFNTFVNPIALDNIGWKYYIVFMVIIVLYGITAFFTYPETRGHSLEQIAHIFDGDDAAAPPPEVIAEETAERGRSVTGSEKVALQHVEKA